MTRSTAMLSIALLVGTYLLEASHFGATDHVVCPEHGELLHVEDPSSGHSPGAPGVGSDLSPSPSSQHDRAVCTIADAPRASTSNRPALASVSWVSVDTPGTGEAWRPIARDVLRQAPKTSPPAHLG